MQLTLESILADCQHGFRSRSSCESQLVQCVHDIISNQDGAVNHGHKHTDLIIMNFPKAFDKAPYWWLLHKLHYYEIRGSIHNRLDLLTGGFGTYSMSCNSQLFRPGGLSTLYFSSTRFIVGLTMYVY